MNFLVLVGSEFYYRSQIFSELHISGDSWRTPRAVHWCVVASFPCLAIPAILREKNTKLVQENVFCCKSNRLGALTYDFFVSKSSFCSIRLIRQLAAYPRFFSVRRRCFIRTISGRVKPRNFSVRFKSRTEIDTNSSSLMSGIGQGDNGACKITQTISINSVKFDEIKLKSYFVLRTMRTQCVFWRFFFVPWPI